MLDELIVKNLGIIEDATLEFDGKGCFVLSGESGAGKTLTLNALNLLRGKRANSSFIAPDANQLSVESSWNISNDLNNKEFKKLLENAGIETSENTDENNEMLISRIIDKNGKSKALLNGNRTTANQLSEITPFLLSIHGQSDQNKLQDPTQQLLTLDNYCQDKIEPSFKQYAETYKNWRKLQKEYEDVKTNAKNKKREMLILESFIKEFETINPLPEEDIELEKEIETLSNLDVIKEKINESIQLIEMEEFEIPPLTTQLTTIIGNLSSISKYDEKLSELVKIGNTATDQVIEFFNEITSYNENIDLDALQKLYEAEERLKEIKKLIKKYGSDLNDVITQYENVNNELAELQKYDVPLDTLKATADKAFKKALENSLKLSKIRQKYADGLAKKVNKELKALAMSGTEFIIAIENSSDLNEFGGDVVSFRIAQHGLNPVEIDKGASGGELSRIMLALELVLAENMPEHCFIFDEIDSGTGGKTSIEIGKRLAKLAKYHQVIVVTHLPQVAAFADKHYEIVKNVIGDKTVASVNLLEGKKKTAEITRMLSGLTDSNNGSLHAEELLKFANDYKAELA